MARLRRTQPEASDQMGPKLLLASLFFGLSVYFAAHFVRYVHLVEKLQAMKTVSIPTAADAPEDLSTMLVLEIDADANIRNDHELIPLETLGETISLKHPTKVVLRVDKTAKYPMLKKILKAVGDAGIKNVTFSVIDSPRSNTQP